VTHLVLWKQGLHAVADIKFARKFEFAPRTGRDGYGATKVPAKLEADSPLAMFRAFSFLSNHSCYTLCIMSFKT
jgi:hypothetical protein